MQFGSNFRENNGYSIGTLNNVESLHSRAAEHVKIKCEVKIV